MGGRPLPERIPPISRRKMPPHATSGIHPPCGGLSPSLGQVAYVLLNRLPLGKKPKSLTPLDLHTLGTPLAFVLSQDQTLHQNWIPFEIRSRVSYELRHRVSIGKRMEVSCCSRSEETQSRPASKRFRFRPTLQFSRIPEHDRRKNPPLAQASKW